MFIKALTGDFAGDVRDIPGEMLLSVLVGFAQQDWQWQCIWQTASDSQEKFLCTRADLVARIVRALMHGRTVTFRGEVYRANPENLESALSYIEDEIVNSGLNVGVEIDNQNGVVIGTGSPE